MSSKKAKFLFILLLLAIATLPGCNPGVFIGTILAFAVVGFLVSLFFGPFIGAIIAIVFLFAYVGSQGAGVLGCGDGMGNAQREVHQRNKKERERRDELYRNARELPRDNRKCKHSEKEPNWFAHTEARTKFQARCHCNGDHYCYKDQYCNRQHYCVPMQW